MMEGLIVKIDSILIVGLLPKSRNTLKHGVTSSVSISCPEVIELAAAARQVEIISRRSLHSNCDGLWECSHATEAKESGEEGGPAMTKQRRDWQACCHQ